MKTRLTTIPIVALLLLYSFINTQLYAQQSNPTYKFIQVHVDQLQTVEESRLVDALLRSQAGVLAARTDHRSKILLCIFDANSGINQTLFSAWLNALGFKIDCYREGLHGVDKIFSREEFVCK